MVLSEFNELCNDYDYVSLFSQSETINDLFLFILIAIIITIIIIIIVIFQYFAVESKGVTTVQFTQSKHFSGFLTHTLCRKCCLLEGTVSSEVECFPPTANCTFLIFMMHLSNTHKHSYR